MGPEHFLTPASRTESRLNAIAIRVLSDSDRVTGDRKVSPIVRPETHP